MPDATVTSHASEFRESNPNSESSLAECRPLVPNNLWLLPPSATAKSTRFPCSPGPRRSIRNSQAPLFSQVFRGPCQGSSSPKAHPARFPLRPPSSLLAPPRRHPVRPAGFPLRPPSSSLAPPRLHPVLPDGTATGGNAQSLKSESSCKYPSVECVRKRHSATSPGASRRHSKPGRRVGRMLWRVLAKGFVAARCFQTAQQPGATRKGTDSLGGQISSTNGGGDHIFSYQSLLCTRDDYINCFENVCCCGSRVVRIEQ